MLFSKSKSLPHKKAPQPAPPEPSSSPNPSPTTTLLSLPPELHHLISNNLTYPDALSLKHTSTHFYTLINTGIHLKVSWLIQRRGLHLDCPHDRACELGSDWRFCRGSVGLLMKRRREHGECETKEGGRGCLVFETKVCEYRKERMGALERLRQWLSLRMGKEVLWWIVVAMVGTVISGALVLGSWWFGFGGGREDLGFMHCTDVVV